MARSNISLAVSALLSWLYTDSLQPIPHNFKTRSMVDRNKAIRSRFANGENTTDLAKAFGVSQKRVYQIIHGQRK